MYRNGSGIKVVKQASWGNSTYTTVDAEDTS